MKNSVVALIGSCFTFALLQSNALAEQWIKLDEITPPLLVDISRITARENRARAWVKADFPNGAMETRWLFEFDCTKGTYRTVEAISRIGTELSTWRYDEQDPFQGIGGNSRYAAAYVLACKSAVGVVAAPAEEQNILQLPPRSSDPEAWLHFESDPQGTDWFLDAKSLRVNTPQVLAWIKAIHPSLTLFSLHEYDCVKSLDRVHAVNDGRLPQPGWSHPTSTVFKAFSLICKKLLTQTPSKEQDESPRERTSPPTKTPM